MSGNDSCDSAVCRIGDRHATDFPVFLTCRTEGKTFFATARAVRRKDPVDDFPDYGLSAAGTIAGQRFLPQSKPARSGLE